MKESEPRQEHSNRVAKMVLIHYFLDRETVKPYNLYICSSKNGSELTEAYIMLLKARSQTTLEGLQGQRSRVIPPNVGIWLITFGGVGIDGKKIDKALTLDENMEKYYSAVELFRNTRRQSPEKTHIILIQKVINAKNIAEKIPSCEKKARLLLFGFYGKSKVTEMSQILGISPPTQRSRTPGEVSWYVERHELPSKYHPIFDNAHSEEELKEALSKIAEEAEKDGWFSVHGQQR